MPRRGRTLAQQADPYACYQQAVQAPENEVAFFERVYRREYGRPPALLREDFCGTALVCCEWVRCGQSRRAGQGGAAGASPGRRAYGVDLDPEPLVWGRRHNVAALPPELRDRIEMVEADACEVRGPKADVVAALNFSFLIFRTRDALRGYFKAARANLAERGVLCMDLLGGWETMQEDRRERRRIRVPALRRRDLKNDDPQPFPGGPLPRKGEGGRPVSPPAASLPPAFTYVWEQARFDPITHDCTFHIHFRFDDGSERRRAFTYRWRLWSIPEVCELLREAGFRRADVYWEGTERATGKGNGVWTRRQHGSSDPSWIACIVGVK